ncbi:MAG: DUF4956 domain-containing protein [Bacteroidales bacterium]|nr:DUF4956 domain-containing protein [Bacteroidales bacterium]
MLTDFQNIFVFSITIKDVIANILVALLCGVGISMIYRWTYKGLSYSASFTVSLVMLTMITSVVIMVIGNNLARAFGMVGAMSIIRFRTAVKDASDIMFIFFSLAIGLACGVKLFSVAIFATIIIGAAFVIINKVNFAMPKRREYLLQLISLSSAGENNEFDNILRKYCWKYKVINVKTLGEEEHDILEISFYVNLKNENKGQVLIAELKKLSNVRQVNLFYDED